SYAEMILKSTIALRIVNVTLHDGIYFVNKCLMYMTYGVLLRETLKDDNLDNYSISWTPCENECHGYSICLLQLVSLVVPEGKGVSSSVSVEVSSMQVIAHAHENSVVGGVCGVIDQMASAGADHESMRIGAFMDSKMIKYTASDISSQSYSNCNGNNIDELEEYEIELVHDEASLDYLCNLNPHNLKLSDTLSGEAFLTKYGHHNDPVTLKKLMVCFNYWFFELMVYWNSSLGVMIMELFFIVVSILAISTLFFLLSQWVLQEMVF
nr:L-arabinokinase-like [Tanacetum cinerariifolium]